MKKIQSKVRLTRIFSLISAGLLLFWWPLSHLFYSDLYHRLLGFFPGSYQPAMVIVIGICGFLPVFNLIIVAVNPLKYKLNIIAIMVFAFLLVCMYSYLILSGVFPMLEIINILLCLFIIGFFSISTPWRDGGGSTHRKSDLDGESFAGHMK